MVVHSFQLKMVVFYVSVHHGIAGRAFEIMIEIRRSLPESLLFLGLRFGRHRWKVMVSPLGRDTPGSGNM